MNTPQPGGLSRELILQKMTAALKEISNEELNLRVDRKDAYWYFWLRHLDDEALRIERLRRRYCGVSK